MQAVILAAGEGKRLRPLTNDCPKTMVCVGGKPILEHTLSILPESIDEVILVVGYKGEKIREHFGVQWFGKKILYAEQPQPPMGTGDALERCRHLLRDERYLLMFADDMYHSDDIAACIAEPTLSILVKEAEHPERMGVCLHDNDGYLTAILEKPEMPSSNLVGIGVYVLDNSIFDIPKTFDKRGEHVLPIQIGNLAKYKPIKVVKARFWHPIGYPEDIEAAERYAQTILHKQLFQL